MSVLHRCKTLISERSAHPANRTLPPKSRLTRVLISLRFFTVRGECYSNDACTIVSVFTLKGIVFADILWPLILPH